MTDTDTTTAADATARACTTLHAHRRVAADLAVAGALVTWGWQRLEKGCNHHLTVAPWCGAVVELDAAHRHLAEAESLLSLPVQASLRLQAERVLRSIADLGDAIARNRSNS